MRPGRVCREKGEGIGLGSSMPCSLPAMPSGFILAPAQPSQERAEPPAEPPSLSRCPAQQERAANLVRAGNLGSGILLPRPGYCPLTRQGGGCCWVRDAAAHRDPAGLGRAAVGEPPWTGNTSTMPLKEIQTPHYPSPPASSQAFANTWDQGGLIIISLISKAQAPGRHIVHPQAPPRCFFRSLTPQCLLCKLHQLFSSSCSLP